MRLFLYSFLFCFITIVQGAELEEKNALNSAQSENRPIVAVFLAENCPWSKKLRQEIIESPYFFEKVQEEAILWIVSLKQHEAEKPFLQKYQVHHCPVILLLDPQAKEFARFEDISLDAYKYAEAIHGQIENFHDICSALDHEFEEERWQDLYHKAKKLSASCFQQVILEQGIRKEKGYFFHLEKFITLMENQKKKNSQVRKAKNQLLSRDPDNKSGLHYKVAVLEFQKKASRLKGQDRPERALMPLLQYLQRFGKKDPENSWKCEWMIAEFLYKHQYFDFAFDRAEIAYLQCPEEFKPQLIEMLSMMKQSVQ